MFGRGPSRITVARHVYLRTQQRRLRHVKSVVVRNLVLPDGHPAGSAALDLTVYFTLQSSHNPDKVLYRSDPVKHSHNPAWETVQFPAEEFPKHSSLPLFTVRLWVKKDSCDTAGESRDPSVASHDPSAASHDQSATSHDSSAASHDPSAASHDSSDGGGDLLAFEKTIELFDVVYLGTIVNKDGSGYPANSVIIGMFEGYYSNPGVGGVPCSPSIVHSLDNLLPPQSLLEVQRSDVCDSYQPLVLKRILNRQEVLNREVVEARACKREVESYLQLRDGYFRKKTERDALGMRIAQLKQQLASQAKVVSEEKEKLANSTREVDLLQKEVYGRQEDLREKKQRYEEDYQRHSRRGEMLVRAKRHQVQRQRNMIFEVAQTFFIQEVDGKFTICNVILPNGDQLEQLSSIEQLGVALGYVAHLVYHLGKILLIPLQYPVQPNGSRSHVVDYISDEALIENIKEFPLFMKGGSERPLFQYAVHLLNKDIAQIRQHCGYGTSKSMLKKTLPNLKSLLDRLTKDKKARLQAQASPQEPPPFRSSAPIDTSSSSSAILTSTSSGGVSSRGGGSGSGSGGGLDSVSVLSGGTATGYSSSSTPTNSPAMHHESYHITPPMSFHNRQSPLSPLPLPSHSSTTSLQPAVFEESEGLFHRRDSGGRFNPDRESLDETTSNYVLQRASANIGFGSGDSRVRGVFPSRHSGNSSENHRELIQNEEDLTHNGGYNTNFILGGTSPSQFSSHSPNSPSSPLPPPSSSPHPPPPPPLASSEQCVDIMNPPSSSEAVTPTNPSGTEGAGNRGRGGGGADVARGVKNVSASSLSSSPEIAVDNISRTADEKKQVRTAGEGTAQQQKVLDRGGENTNPTGRTRDRGNLPDGHTTEKAGHEQRGSTGKTAADEKTLSLDVELVDNDVASRQPPSSAGQTPPPTRTRIADSSPPPPSLRGRLANSVTRRYHPVYSSNDLGYIRTQVATPHILSSSGGGGGANNSNSSSPGTSRHGNVVGGGLRGDNGERRNAMSNRYATSSPENSDAQFLEDFIDGP